MNDNDESGCRRQVALTDGLGLVPDATWAAVERYADEVHDFNVAVKIDVGVDKASAKCLKAEADARKAVLAFAAAAVAAERERNAGWFALVMSAAAALEDASNCLRDQDAKRAAEGAAKHCRSAANAMLEEFWA